MQFEIYYFILKPFSWMWPTFILTYLRFQVMWYLSMKNPLCARNSTTNLLYYELQITTSFRSNSTRYLNEKVNFQYVFAEWELGMIIKHTRHPPDCPFTMVWNAFFSSLVFFALVLKYWTTAQSLLEEITVLHVQIKAMI